MCLEVFSLSLVFRSLALHFKVGILVLVSKNKKSCCDKCINFSCLEIFH